MKYKKPDLPAILSAKNTWKQMTPKYGSYENQLSKESIEGKDPYMWYKDIN